MQTFISFIIIFGLLVFFHELGHFALAKINKIKVHKFALGMGPKILKYQGKETEYSLRLLPIGGFVKMEGEDEASNDKNSFNSKSPLQRLSVLAAGPIMNVILAVLLISIVIFSIGIPSNMNIVGDFSKSSPAKLAGIKKGDKIVKINNTDINSWEDIHKTISKSKEQELKIQVIRNNKTLSFNVIPILDKESNRRIIGINQYLKKSLYLSVKYSIEGVFYAISQIFDILFKLITGEPGIKDQFVGPIGIIDMINKATAASSSHVLLDLLLLAANLSISLAIFNILPIPALDGGRILFILIELIKGKPIDPEKEGFVHLFGFVILMGLMVLVLYKDIVRFILN